MIFIIPLYTMYSNVLRDIFLGGTVLLIQICSQNLKNVWIPWPWIHIWGLHFNMIVQQRTSYYILYIESGKVQSFYMLYSHVKLFASPRKVFFVIFLLQISVLLTILWVCSLSHLSVYHSTEITPSTHTQIPGCDTRSSRVYLRMIRAVSFLPPPQ